MIRLCIDVYMSFFGFSSHIVGEGNGNPLQYSCLENPMDGGAWGATVHGVAKSRTRLSDLTHSLTLMTNRWGNNENREGLYFGGLQNHCRW